MPRPKKFKSDYIEVMKSQLSRCFEPTGKCEAKAIKAHSIQNRRVIDQLSENGHVVMISMFMDDLDNPPRFSFQKIGRNRASTFTGLCSHHDNAIFNLLDQNEFDSKNREMLFLLAYRSVLKELYSALLGAHRMEKMFSKRTGEKIANINKSEHYARTVRGFMFNAHQMMLYKKEFDDLYLSAKYQNLIHHIFYFEHKQPTVAVSSPFSLDDIPTPHYVARIVLNVFPSNEKTYIIFSYLFKDAPYAAQYLKSVFLLSGTDQLHLFSKIILESCENFVLPPSYFESLPLERRKLMAEYFSETIDKNKPYENLGQLSLFEPK